MTITRHFTVTGFVIHEERCLLHWHRKVKMWLPPGGHIEPNEDPVQAVLRETHEETGIQVQVIPSGVPVVLDYPTQVQPPFTIMVEDIHDPVDGYHQHIDLIYFCKPSTSPPSPKRGWLWVSRASLIAAEALQIADSPRAVPPEDVRILAEHAFAAASKEE